MEGKKTSCNKQEVKVGEVQTGAHYCHKHRVHKVHKEEVRPSIKYGSCIQCHTAQILVLSVINNVFRHGNALSCTQTVEEKGALSHQGATAK